MKRNFSHGSSQQFEQAVRRRIEELDPTSVTSATDVGTGRNKADVLKFLGNKGYDTSSPEVDSYADAVVEYLDMCDNAWKESGKQRAEEYSLDQWYKETEMNYPGELQDLPKANEVESCDNPIMTATEPKVLWDAVETSLKEKGIECSITPEPEAVVVYCGTTQYTVPYEDLHLDAEHIDDDVDYIVGYIDNDMNNDDGEGMWEIYRTKSVRDSDGFWTDYTLWHNIATDEYVCVFGDNELYTPDNYSVDAGPFETEEEALEWFDDYDDFDIVYDDSDD